MLMTSADLKNLISQVNEAFKGQFNRLSDLEAKVAELEEKLNEQSKRPKAGASRGKRVQQTEENA